MDARSPMRRFGSSRNILLPKPPTEEHTVQTPPRMLQPLSKLSNRESDAKQGQDSEIAERPSANPFARALSFKKFLLPEQAASPSLLAGSALQTTEAKPIGSRKLPGALANVAEVIADRIKSKKSLSVQEKRSREMDEIRARTMYNMVDSVPAGKKLVFLTNMQASLFSVDTISKLLEVFEAGSPKLVVRLLCSINGSDSIKYNLPDILYQDEEIIEKKLWKQYVDCDEGVIPVLPFVTSEEGMAAEKKIDVFMHKTLLPLVIKTNAIVICNPSRACTLGMSFGRAVSFISSRYGNKLPFTVLAMDSAMNYIENCSVPGDSAQRKRNHEDTTTWKFFNNSPAWQEHYPRICQAAAVQEEKSEIATVGHATMKGCNNPESRIFPDLNPYIPNLIIVDGVDEDEDGVIRGTNFEALENLRLLILYNLMAALPVVAIGSLRHDNEQGLKEAASLVDANVPVVYIDVRNRAPLDPNSTPDQLLETAKASHDQEWDKIFKAGCVDVLDVCRIAYFHNVFLEMMARTRKDANDAVIKANRGSSDRMTLFEAIQYAKSLSGNDAKENSLIQDAVASNMASFLVDSQYRSYWECLADDSKAFLIRKEISYKVFFETEIQATWIYVYNLIINPNFFSANINDTKFLEDLLESIVIKDRLPTRESLQGLIVLRSVWDAIDIGNSYLMIHKLVSKLLYAFILLTGIITVTLVVLSDMLNQDIPTIDSGSRPVGSIIFYLAVLTTVVTAFNSYFNPTSRWQAIRHTTSELESLIWQYRTRTGPFKMNARDSDNATMMLKNLTQDAMDTLVSSPDIGNSSAWGKTYPARVFKHGQYSELKRKTLLGGIVSALRKCTETLSVHDRGEAYAIDDYYSPLTPDKFVQLRLRPMIKFYQHRLPRYSRFKNYVSVLLTLITSLGTVLAYKEYTAYVSICSSVSAAITSWMEYNSIAKKVGRYNTNIQALDALKLWWLSLPDVDRNVMSNIDLLVQAAEQIINSERKAWLSAPTVKDKQEKGAGSKEDRSDEQADGKAAKRDAKAGTSHERF